MKSHYGKSVVEWDGDFKFEVASHSTATVDIAPARAVGAAFISGNGTVVHIDQDGNRRFFNVMGAEVIEATSNASLDDLSYDSSWTICGPGVADPLMVSDLCRRAKAYSVSVCPLLEPLGAFGALVGQLLQEGKEKPRMTRFCEPWEDAVNDSGQQFEENLDGDGYGRMAHLVQARTPVLNQMMRTPCIKAFYGRVLTTGWWGRNPIFLMTAASASDYFPTEPLSVRSYAAMWVPVSVSNTDKFAQKSGFGKERVNIFVASEMTPGLGTFLGFAQVIGGETFVASSNPESMPRIREKIPVFRAKGAYNVDDSMFREVMNES